MVSLYIEVETTAGCRVLRIEGVSRDIDVTMGATVVGEPGCAKRDATTESDAACVPAAVQLRIDWRGRRVDEKMPPAASQFLAHNPDQCCG